MSNLPTVFNSISAETNVRSGGPPGWWLVEWLVDIFIFHSDLIFNFYTLCE